MNGVESMLSEKSSKYAPISPFKDQNERRTRLQHLASRITTRQPERELGSVEDISVSSEKEEMLRSELRKSRKEVQRVLRSGKTLRSKITETRMALRDSREKVKKANQNVTNLIEQNNNLCVEKEELQREAESLREELKNLRSGTNLDLVSSLRTQLTNTNDTNRQLRSGISYAQRRENELKSQMAIMAADDLKIELIKDLQEELFRFQNIVRSLTGQLRALHTVHNIEEQFNEIVVDTGDPEVELKISQLNNIQFGHLDLRRMIPTFIGVGGNEYTIEQPINDEGAHGAPAKALIYGKSADVLQVYSKFDIPRPQRAKSLRVPRSSRIKTEVNSYDKPFKVLVVASRNLSKYAQALAMAGLWVDTHDSYEEHESRLQAKMKSADITLICTGHTRHYALDFISPNDPSVDRVYPDNVGNIMARTRYLARTNGLL
jgi:hypothetical protein